MTDDVWWCEMMNDIQYLKWLVTIERSMPSDAHHFKSSWPMITFMADNILKLIQFPCEWTNILFDGTKSFLRKRTMLLQSIIIQLSAGCVG